MKIDNGLEAGNKRISELFSPFCDSSTKLKISDIASDTYKVEGARQFQSFQLSLRWDATKSELVEVHSAKGKEQLKPISELLASHRFGNLHALARAMNSFLKNKLGNPNEVVEGKLDVNTEDPDYASPKRSPAFSVLVSALTHQSKYGTHLAFLHGNAGSGKSWMLMQAVLKRAQDFIKRLADSLFLYIDAQGVNLRSLEQQIALQLDTYGGFLRCTEIIPLIRVGALGLVIDGFDELIMPSGYNDTLSALCNYLESLQGEGVVLASTRTAFFDTYDLESAGVHVSEPLVKTILKVVPWEASEREEYCGLRHKAALANDIEVIANRSDETKDLLGRPFIVSELVKLLQIGGAVGQCEVMKTIEDAFLERESKEKLINPDNKSPLLNSQQLRNLLMEISLEMWHLRETTIDAESLRILTKIFLEEWRIPLTYRDVISQRMELNPILQVSRKTSLSFGVQFPHEILFSRFLAMAIIQKISMNSIELKSLLREAPLSESTLEQIALIGSNISISPLEGLDSDIEQLLDRFVVLGTSSSTRLEDKNIRQNIGAIIWHLLPLRDGTKPLEIKRCSFEKARFNRAKLSKLSFVECSFEDIDARDADWTGAIFRNCLPISNIKINRGQAFPSSFPPVLWLLVLEPNGETNEYFGEKQCHNQLFPEISGLQKIETIPIRSDNAKRIAEVVIKIARRAIKTYWISVEPEDKEDSGLHQLKQDRHWSRTIELLEKHGLLQRGTIHRQGNRAEMFHLELPKELILGESGSVYGIPVRINTFWNEINSM